MIPWMILFWILELLVEFFIKDWTSATDWQKQRAGHAMFLMRKAMNAGHACGCLEEEDIVQTGKIATEKALEEHIGGK